jgi:hypothetical protein
MGSEDIEYGKLLQRALRTVVREVLERTVRDGLPGEHHFYITLRTDHPRTEAPPFVRQRHPEEMTVVLQHQFWDLVVDDDGFAVTLRFDGMPARLRAPWDAVVAFFDPTAEFGLRFDLPGLAGTGGGGKPQAVPSPAVPSESPATSDAQAGADDDPDAAAPKSEANAPEANGKVLSFGRPRERRDPEES